MTEKPKMLPIDDPARHRFEPNGDGHKHYSELCWWCGKPKQDHLTECYPAWMEKKS